MTLSSRTWNRLSRQGATVKTIEQRSRRMFGLATVGVALVAAGIGTPTATLADDATFDPPTQNERSIALIESKEAPGGVLAGGIPNTERFGDW